MCSGFCATVNARTCFLRRVRQSWDPSRCAPAKKFFRELYLATKYMATSQLYFGPDTLPGEHIGASSYSARMTSVLGRRGARVISPESSRL